MTHTTHKTVTVSLCGVEITCTGVEFWPYEPATLMDPPQSPDVSWGKVFIADVEVQELFHGDIGKQLEEALIKHLEE